MRLFLLRHGETDWLAEGRLQGNAPVPLNARGREQARLAAGAVRNIRPARIFSSTLLRARQTAEIIAGECGMPHESDARLNEIFFGDWEGRHHADLEAGYPALYRDWLELKPDFSPPAGECVTSVAGRVRHFFEALRPSSETVVAVSHGGPIRLLLLDLLGAPLQLFRAIPLDPCSMFLVENGNGRARVLDIHPGTGEPEAEWRFTGQALEASNVFNRLD
ncbi:MAG: histidine phosphatase family protein [Candidatus Omnitrophica bacterium]|nr:histidine phosphatase family protein [Candidatus Omnitrophota bacterium]